MSQKWCLIQPSTKKKLYGLMEAEVELISYALNEKEIKTWYIWTEGWENWKSLSEFENQSEIIKHNMKPPEINDDDDGVEFPNFMSNRATSQLDDNGEVGRMTVVDSDEDLNVESTAGEYHFREHARMSKRFKVIIKKDGKEFSTYTVDVSVGGALLEDPIPNWVIGYCNLVLIKPNEKQQVLLTCSIVDGQEPDAKFRIEISPLESHEQTVKLKGWLAA